MTDSLPSDFIADGQPFENPEASADVGYAATVPSLGAKLQADFGDGLTAALGRAAQRGQQQGASWFDRLATMPDVDTAAGMVAGGQDPYPEPAPSPTISAEEANKRFAPPGTTITDGPMSERLARVVGQQKADEVKRDSVLSRFAAGHGFAANTATGLLLSPLMDPVGTGAMFVPGLGEETIAAHLGEGLIARTGARAAAGASAGAAGMGVAAAGKYALGTEQDSDYTLRSAMYDMAAGAALGALGHAGFGALREAGALKPDGLMAAEQSRAAAGLPPAEAPTGLVSNEDLGAVLDAPATARFDALNAGVAQVLDGRQVDVAPIFDQVRADRAEAELQRWTAQQGRLDAQSTAALQASSLSDAAAGTVESRAAVLQKRLDDLRGQHAGFLADIEDATARQAAQADTVTPQRLGAIDAELSDTAIPAARRTALENERALLTEGRDPAADALEAARTEAELQGLQRGAAAVQSEIDRTAGKVEPLQVKAAAQRAAGSDALDAASDRIAGQEATLRSLAARSIRRYAGAFGADVTRDEADALALRSLRGGPDEVAKVVAEIRGRVAPSSTRVAQPAPALAGPPIEQQRAAIANDVTRQLVAAGRPEREARAHARIVAAHYEARASRFGGALGTAEDLYRQRAAEIRGSDAAPAPATTPTKGSGSGGAAAPQVYDRASLMARFSDDDGRFDLGQASDAVRAEVGAALDQGRPVTYRVEGRSFPIVSAEDGRLLDDKGQAWGLFQIVQPRPGDANRIEIGVPRKIGTAADSAVPAYDRVMRSDVQPAAESILEDGGQATTAPEIAPGEPAAPEPEAVVQIAADVLPEAVEPVRAIVEAEDEIAAVAPPEAAPESAAQPELEPAAQPADAPEAPAVVLPDAVDGPSTGQPRPLPSYTPDAAAAAPRGKDQPAGVFMFDPLALAIDAGRFQFKSDGDAFGVTAALRGVTRWDPAKAQSIMVWEEADGRLFVADGHQRAGLARRLTEQGQAGGIELPGVLYRARDGVTADDARAIAAVSNIANGSGSALDGAKVLRSRPDLLDGSVPLSAGKGQQAAALARLDDEAFRMIVNDVVPEHFGAVVGQIIPADGARQVAALKAIARFEPRSVEEATALTQRVSSAELARAEEGRQASMFGDLDAPESTAGEEMRIVGRVIRDLRRDRGLFSRVVANASRLEATGSTIERDAARSAATDAGAFAKVLSSDAYTAGPTRTALLDAAKDLQNGRTTIGDAAARLYAAIRRSAEEDGPDRAGARRGDAASQGDAVGLPLDAGDGGGTGGPGRDTGDRTAADAAPGRSASDAAAGPGGSAGAGRGDGDRTRAAGRAHRQGREAAATAARRGDRGTAAGDGLGQLLGRLIGDEASTPAARLLDPATYRGDYPGDAAVGQLVDIPLRPDVMASSAGEAVRGRLRAVWAAGQDGRIDQTFASAVRELRATFNMDVPRGGLERGPDGKPRLVSPNEVMLRDLQREAQAVPTTLFQGVHQQDPFAEMMAALDRLNAEHDSTPLAARPMSETGIVDPHAPVWRLYHGTGVPEHFGRFDPAAEGSRTSGAERGALFTSPRPDEAGTYAEDRYDAPLDAAGARIFPLDVRPGNTAVYDVGRLLAERDPRFMAASRAEFDDGYGAEGTGRDQIYADALRRFDEDVAYHEDLKQRLGPDHGLPDFPAMSNLLHPQAAAIRLAREDGRDTAILRGLGESAGGDQVVVLKPGFASSAIDPEHLFYQGDGRSPRGSITFLPGARPLLRLMADADASTFVHEMGHDWLEQMMRDAAHPAAPDLFRADAQVVRTWLGNDGGALTVEQHEKWATATEQYLRAGEAPTPELAGVFAQLKDWLTRIYRTVTGLGAPINDDIRGVFDRLLTPETDRPAPQVPTRPDIAALAQRQQALYRGGFAPGMPQAEFDALNAAVYGTKAPGEAAAAGGSSAAPRSGDAGDPRAPGTDGAAPGAAQPGPRTAADAVLATLQQRFDAAGVVPTAEERALIDATRSRVRAADLSAEGYAQAGACLTAAGI